MRRVSVGGSLARAAWGGFVRTAKLIAAPPALTEDAKELAADVGAEALEKVTLEASSGESTIVARLNPRTRATKGEEVDLVVDTARLHFFDPADGSAVHGT